MGISSIGGATAGSATLLTGFAAGVAGTYTLDSVLDPGIYKMSMDSSQSLTFVFSNSANNYPTFSGSTRGGSGWVSIPYQMDRVVFPSATYPFVLTLEKLSQNQLAAPTGHSIAYNAQKTAVIGTWSGVPAGTTKVTFYYKSGSTTYASDFSSTTSGATAAITAGTAPPAGAGISYGIVCTNAQGVAGLMGTGTTGTVPSATTTVQFTSSGVWVSPITGTLTNLLVVAGGGNGGGSGVPGSGGAGGAGGYRTSSIQSVSQGVSYTITVGGANTNSSFNGTFSASRGGTPSAAGGSGGGGGGDGMSGNGPGGAGNLGGYTPPEGNSGGSGQGTTGSAGGGGAGGVGQSTSGNGAGGVGVFNSITGTSVEYARGGQGGASTGSPAGYGYGGGGGSYNAGQSGGTGYAGIVILQYAY